MVECALLLVLKAPIVSALHGSFLDEAFTIRRPPGDAARPTPPASSRKAVQMPIKERLRGSYKGPKS